MPKERPVNNNALSDNMACKQLPRRSNTAQVMTYKTQLHVCHMQATRIPKGHCIYYNPAWGWQHPLHTNYTQSRPQHTPSRALIRPAVGVTHCDPVPNHLATATLVPRAHQHTHSYTHKIQQPSIQRPSTEHMNTNNTGHSTHGMRTQDKVGGNTPTWHQTITQIVPLLARALARILEQWDTGRGMWVCHKATHEAKSLSKHLNAKQYDSQLYTRYAVNGRYLLSTVKATNRSKLRS